MAGRRGFSRASLYVTNLSWRTASKELKDYFSNFGRVKRVDVQMDKLRGKNTGAAFVHFSDPETMNAVLEQGNHVIDDVKINVDPKHNNARSRRGEESDGMGT